MEIMACPKCNNDWVADRGLMAIQHRKKWWHLIATWMPYHEVYHEAKRFHCVICGNEWGEWKK